MARKESQSARRSKPSTQSEESANTDTQDTSSAQPARPSQLANVVRRSAGRTWWTRDRVVSGLRRFHLDHGLTPTSTEEWHQLTARRGYRGGGSGLRRPYPSFYAILRYFETFRQAWAAVGIDVGRRQESWSEIEDWYLREGVGVISRTELARDLQRTPNAVH